MKMTEFFSQALLVDFTMEQQYRVILSGELKEGWTLEKAAEALAKLMKCETAKAATILKQAPTKLKKIMPRDSAEKYKQRIEQTGVICAIQPNENPGSNVSGSLSLESKDTSPIAKNAAPASPASKSTASKSGGLSLEGKDVTSSASEASPPTPATPTAAAMVGGLSLEPMAEAQESADTPVEQTSAEPAIEQSIVEQPIAEQSTIESSTTEQSVIEQPADPSRVICPKCKLEQDKIEECAGCGVIISKAIQASQAAVMTAVAASEVTESEAEDDIDESSDVDFNSEEIRKLLKNTYMLLAMTLVFSAITAAVGMNYNMENTSTIVVLIGAIALFGLTYFTRNSGFGILSIFAFTGWMGFWIGPTLNYYLMFSNGGTLITTAAAMTAAVFLGLSGYVLISKKDFTFLGSFLFAGLVVLICGFLAALFFNIPGFVLALSVMGVFIFSGYILYDTSQLIHGGEDNYIMATVSLYLDVINLFLHLLRILAAFAGED